MVGEAMNEKKPISIYIRGIGTFLSPEVKADILEQKKNNKLK